MLIYRIINLVNEKSYIGLDSTDEPNRVKYHFFAKRRRTIIEKAITKHGFENFKVEILQRCSSMEELNEAEVFWISYYETTNTKFGYNILPGGRGYKLSDIKDDKRRNDMLKSRLRGFRKKWEGKTLEFKRKSTEHLRSLSANAKRSNTLKNYWTDEANSNHIIERRKRMAIGWAKKNNEYEKPYVIISPDNREFKTISLYEMCSDLNISAKMMRKVAKGELKHYKGWKCFYG